MKKFIFNKEAMSSNPAYNTWAVAIYDRPDDKSTGLYVFLKSLDSEIIIDESVQCLDGWYYVTLNDTKGFFKQNYQVNYVEI